MTRVGLTPATFDPATMGERRLAFPEEEYAARLETLRERHHVYTPPDSRINVAGVSQANVDYVADSIAPLSACSRRS